jgi:hypothetical protein
MADTVIQTAQQATDYTRSALGGVTDSLRQNPVPFALLGLGAAWLIARRFSSSRPASSDSGRRYLDDAPDRDEAYFTDAGDSMRQMARTGPSQLLQVVQDHPLVVGCGVLMLGVAFGLALPETEVENEWLGEARDTVLGRTRDLVRDAVADVQDAAGTLADAAGKIAGHLQS